jgi:hypothetical protein
MTATRPDAMRPRSPSRDGWRVFRRPIHHTFPISRGLALGVRDLTSRGCCAPSPVWWTATKPEAYVLLGSTDRERLRDRLARPEGAGLAAAAWRCDEPHRIWKWAGCKPSRARIRHPPPLPPGDTPGLLPLACFGGAVTGGRLSGEGIQLCASSLLQRYSACWASS